MSRFYWGGGGLQDIEYYPWFLAPSTFSMDTKLLSSPGHSRNGPTTAIFSWASINLTPLHSENLSARVDQEAPQLGKGTHACIICSQDAGEAYSTSSLQVQDMCSQKAICVMQSSTYSLIDGLDHVCEFSKCLVTPAPRTSPKALRYRWEEHCST